MVLNSLNRRYVALQGSYWGSNAFIVCFASVFLLSRGFSNAEIGIVLATANLLAALIQPPLASFADRARSISLSQIAIIATAVAAAFAALLLVAPHTFSATGSLFILLTTVHLIGQPLVISIGSFFLSRGRELNFGFARGVGSLCYALGAAGLGFVIDACGANAVLVAALAAFAAVVLACARIDTRKAARVGHARLNEDCALHPGEAQRSSGLLRFALDHKRYLVMLVGFCLIFIEHNILNNYMFQIVEPLGGTAADAGLALSIAALSEIPVMWFFTSLFRVFRCHTLMRISAVCFTVKGLAFVCAGCFEAVCAAQTLQACGNALLMVASVYYINGIIPEKDQVKGQTLFTTFTTLGAVLGSFFGGQLIGWVGISGMLVVGCAVSALGTCIAVAAAQPLKKA